MKRPRLGRPPKESKQRSRGKPTRIFIETVPWGEDSLDLDFVESLDSVLKNMKKDVDELRGKCLPILEKIILAYQTDNLKKFFPQEPMNDECGHSREGLEFLDAISFGLFQEITQGKDFDELAKRHKFMK